MDYIEQIKKQLQEVDTLINFAEKENTKISKSNVAWHLDHSLKVINGISEALNNSKASDYKTNFNKMRFVIFNLGFIPRGKGKVPEAVKPPKNISITDIKTQLSNAQKTVNTLRPLPPKANFKHPIFGLLNKKQTLKFIQLHTNHHFKIIKDIVK